MKNAENKQDEQYNCVFSDALFIIQKTLYYKYIVGYISKKKVSLINVTIESQKEVQSYRPKLQKYTITGKVIFDTLKHCTFTNRNFFALSLLFKSKICLFIQISLSLLACCYRNYRNLILGHHFGAKKSYQVFHPHFIKN